MPNKTRTFSSPLSPYNIHLLTDWKNNDLFVILKRMFWNQVDRTRDENFMDFSGAPVSLSLMCALWRNLHCLIKHEIQNWSKKKNKNLPFFMYLHRQNYNVRNILWGVFSNATVNIERVRLKIKTSFIYKHRRETAMLN